MKKLSGLKPEKVFKYFEELSQIPRGSGNMEKISEYCVKFAREHSLKYVHDRANNVIIYKSGSGNLKNSKPVILQGHLDMVCQKTEDCGIDFNNDGPDLYTDGDFVKAKGTTLGADNGIAVAMIMAILDSEDIEHPPIEAVFTTDEEIGLIGAGALDMSLLSGKKMINIDSEDPDVLTVSCAGGSDFNLSIPFERKNINGTKVSISISGLKGGHSGVCINMGRVNADVLMGRILNLVKTWTDFNIISLNGGDKGNAIPNACKAELVTEDAEKLINHLNEQLAIIKEEISAREPDFDYSVKTENGAEVYSALDKSTSEKVIYVLCTAPNGVCEMSAEISGLVETSLNLGILKTEQTALSMQFALRSNKQSALDALEKKLEAFAKLACGEFATGGHYPPWEYKDNSELQKKYIEAYAEKFGKEPEVVAIHAGLECGLFSSAIEGIDCISIGPLMNGIHTVNEQLSISSTEDIFEVLKNVLKKLF